MTTPQEIRDLAQCLLTYEAGTGSTSESEEPATLRVYEKLRRSLVAFAGIAGFHSLASRALALARPEDPSLRAAQVVADGSLQGLGEFGPQSEMNKSQGGEHRAGEGGVVLIVCLLGLLLNFLGEALTLRLLREAWPSALFGECNMEKGRKV